MFLSEFIILHNFFELLYYTTGTMCTAVLNKNLK